MKIRLEAGEEKDVPQPLVEVNQAILAWSGDQVQLMHLVIRCS